MMRHLRLNGNNIETLGYDAVSMKMEVVFAKAPEWVYTYEHVPVQVFDEIVLAHRPGPVFYKLVRSRPDLFPYRRRKVSPESPT